MEAVNPVSNEALPLWATPKKIAFRYFFIFIGLQTLYGFNRQHFYNNQAKLGWHNFLGSSLYWLDTHIYHIGYNPANIVLVKTTDTPIGWVINLTIIWLAAAGCIAWSVTDWRKANYNKLDYWFRTYLAYYLYMAMVVYAVSKIVVSQMPFPNAGSLLEPLGTKSRFGLLWSFVGASPGYSIFTGICELAASFLVLIRRTRVFGCLFMTTILANIVCFNVFYNITVKLLSLQLLLINIYMLVPYILKLIKIFYHHKPVSLQEKQYSFATPWKNALMLCPLIIPALITYNTTRFYISLGKKEVPRQQQKVYDVTNLIKGKDTLPLLITDTFLIKRFVFTAYHEKKYALVYSMKDDFFEYYYTWDSAHKYVTLINSNDSTEKNLLHYNELPKNQLLFTGQWKRQNVTMLLNKFAIDSMPLVKEKIKWVQNN